ncbi:MAG: EAL and HDOD domain-containing protein [Candidatus Binatia bacterium]
MAVLSTASDQVLLGRQPIFGAQLDLYAYELLYRNSQENQATITDEDLASARTMISAFLEIGLDQVVGSHKAFLNLPRLFIVENYCQELPKDRVVLEILENVNPDPRTVQVLSQLSAQGYTIALDDFVYRDSLRAFLEIAHIVKLDVLSHDRETLKNHVALLQPYKVKLIAEKVETREDFEFCKGLGFDYFQGFFFCKPNIIQGHRVPANQRAILALLANLLDPNISFSKVEAIVRQDLSLSCKVLRYVNSAFFGLSRKIDSIGEAAIMVGLVRLKMWAMLIALASLEGKPPELLVTGLLRARMCEQLAERMRQPAPDNFFTVGLFSVLDALFDSTMANLIASLGLSPEVSEALIDHEGIMGKTLECVLDYDRGDWEKVQDLDLPQSALRDTYLEAIAWSSSVLPFLNP